MIAQIAHVYAMGCVAISFFQIALILGAPLGRYTQGGQHPGALPTMGRVLAALSIFILLFMGLAILSAAGFPGLDWPRWTGWVALGIQSLSMVANWITPSKPERALWGPVTAVLAAMALVVMTA